MCMLWMKVNLMNHLNMSDTDTTESSLSDHEMETSCSTSLLAATDVPSSASVPLLETKTSLPFKLVGDNIDKNVRPRYLRSSIHRTESLHYFHSYAVRDRIGFNELPHKQPSGCLPSKHTSPPLYLVYLLNTLTSLISLLQMWLTGTLITNTTKRCHQSQKWYL